MRIDTQIIEIEWSQDGLADSWLKIGAEKKGTRMAKEPGAKQQLLSYILFQYNSATQRDMVLDQRFIVRCKANCSDKGGDGNCSQYEPSYVVEQGE